MGTTMKIPLTCIARGHEGHWEAACLDFDIVLQGHSFEEVERLMHDAVQSYIENALKEEEPARSQLLRRRAPLSARLYWVGGLLWATLCGRKYDLNSDKEAAVPFAVPCLA